jgi:hypothetical protein
MVVQKKTCMICFLFKELFSFFMKLVLGGISQSNRHLLILNMHGSHVSLEAIDQTSYFGLDMVTLPTHTFHALQPLGVSCFKPFNFTFKKERNSSMVRNNHLEPDKVTLAG